MALPPRPPMVLTPGPSGRRLVLLCLVLSACSDAPPPPAEPGTPEPAAGLSLSADGLGGLDADTPFEPDAVRQAVGHGVTAELAPGTEADMAVGTIWVLRDGLLLAEVIADPRMAGPGLTRVEVTGAGIPGPGSAEVGQAFSETGVARRACEVGTDALAGSAVCDADGVQLVFAHSGDPAALPPAEALGDALLTRMIWRAR